MEVRRYEGKDFAQIEEWGKAYGAKYREDQFPITGFIVDGLAAYFLYTTDSSVCFLENLISNKNADALEKDKAIKLCCDEILKEAKARGYKIAYATTDNYSVVVRAIAYGAIPKAHQTTLTKTLTDPSI